MKPIIAIVLAALLLAACASTSQVEDLEARVAALEATMTTNATSTGRITGSVAAIPLNYGCRISDDKLARAGDQITLHDGSDAILTSDKLKEDTVGDSACVFTFGFTDIPPDTGFFRIRLHDASWEYSRPELEGLNWSVRLTSP